MTPTTVTVTITITKQITPTNPDHPSGRLAAVIAASVPAIDFRAIYGDLGADTTVTIEASEERSTT